MSGLDDAAKQSIVPLIQGKSAIVTQAMQRDIVAWLTKMAMIGDTVNPEKSMVLQADRSWIMNRRMPPEKWEVRIGCYAGTDRSWPALTMFQHGGSLSLLGRMFGLVLGTGIDRISFGLGDETRFLCRIWPTGGAFSWPYPRRCRMMIRGRR
jgi:hypothetical protein